MRGRGEMLVQARGRGLGMCRLGLGLGLMWLNRVDGPETHTTSFFCLLFTGKEAKAGVLDWHCHVLLRKASIRTRSRDRS